MTVGGDGMAFINIEGGEDTIMALHVGEQIVDHCKYS